MYNEYFYFLFAANANEMVWSLPRVAPNCTIRKSFGEYLAPTKTHQSLLPLPYQCMVLCVCIGGLERYVSLAKGVYTFVYVFGAYYIEHPVFLHTSV